MNKNAKSVYTDLYEKEMPEEVVYYVNFFTKALHTGSRVICDPPPEGTDDDWVLLVPKELLEPFEGILSQSGFVKGGSPGEQSERAGRELGGFHSWKKYEHIDVGDDCINLILTSSEDFLEKTAKATWLAKRLNLLKKEDRVSLFRAIREDLFEEIPEKESVWNSPLTKMQDGQRVRMPLNVWQGAFANQAVMVNQAMQAAVPIQDNRFWQVDWGNVAQAMNG